MNKKDKIMTVATSVVAGFNAAKGSKWFEVIEPKEGEGEPIEIVPYRLPCDLEPDCAEAYMKDVCETIMHAYTLDLFGDRLVAYVSNDKGLVGGIRPLRDGEVYHPIALEEAIGISGKIDYSLVVTFVKDNWPSDWDNTRSDDEEQAREICAKKGFDFP